MFLLDTVVLSELRKPPEQHNQNLVRWIATVPSQDLFVSVVTIGEIERGIARQQTLDPAFSQRLASWLDLILHIYESRILVFNENEFAVDRYGFCALGVDASRRGLNLVKDDQGRSRNKDTAPHVLSASGKAVDDRQLEYISAGVRSEHFDVGPDVLAQHFMFGSTVIVQRRRCSTNLPAILVV